MTAELIREYGRRPVSYMVVSEAGASVYSASKLAAEEFPEFDVNLRSRGVHRPAAPGPPGGAGEDRPQGHRRGPVPARYAPGPAGRGPGRRGGGLRQRRGRGREHRLPLPAAAGGRASTPAAAKNIVAYREENGAFTSRTAAARRCPSWAPRPLSSAPGFLRVPESKNVLDNTAVHPESYAGGGEAARPVRLHPGRTCGQPCRAAAAPGGQLGEDKAAAGTAAWACPPCGTSPPSC